MLDPPIGEHWIGAESMPMDQLTNGFKPASRGIWHSFSVWPKNEVLSGYL